MTFGSLFAGIGGFDLGLERAGMTCRWQVEIDPFCRKVLTKHWPRVPKFEDVREVGAHNLERVDLLCGGFPCQDVSAAGRRVGIEGTKSGLWSEYRRLVRELRPNIVLVENVPGLLVRGFGRVLGELAALGYDAEWESLPASAFGAPHLRYRVWIVAYTSCERRREESGGASRHEGPYARGATLHDHQPRGDGQGDGSRTLADAVRERGEIPAPRERRQSAIFPIPVVDHEAAGLDRWGEQWAVEPDVGRVAYGVPARLDRLRGLGNAVVPQIAEWLGRRILATVANR